MPHGRKKNNMLIPTIIMGVIAAVLLYIGYHGGEGAHIVGLRSAFKMTIEIIPLLVFAFVIAGMIQTLIPQETVASWVGEKSGFRGILIGSLAGGLTPGGPFVSLPIAAGLMRSGAGIGTMVAFLTGWSLWAVSRIPMEIGVLGWKLSAIRFASTIIFPPIAGLIAQALFSGGH